VTVAFDAATEQVGSADPLSFTHTPVGTPRGVVVLGANGSSDTTDRVVGVTYGGVALTRVQTNIDSTGELGRVYIYFLGSGIPTGAQTVSVDKTAVAAFTAVAVTLTADADTVVLDSDGIDEDVANPQVTLSYGGNSGLALCVLFSGTPDVPVGTLLSGMSRVHDNDLGVAVQTVDRQTTASITDFTIGYTLASDDVAFSAIAIGERAGLFDAAIFDPLIFDQPAIGGTDADAGLASGTGSALVASVHIQPNAGLSSGTGAAGQANPNIQPNAGAASGTGTANTALVGVAPAGGLASGTGTAGSASASVAPNAGHAAGTGAANDATVSTAVFVDANAGHASGTGSAHDATTAVSAIAGVGAGTGTAYDPTITAVSAVTSTGSRGKPRRRAGRGDIRFSPVANPPVVVSALAGVATGRGTAFGPTTDWNDDDTAISLLLLLDDAA